MIPYKGEEIFSMQDVQDAYPKYFSLQDLKKRQVKKFYKTELEKVTTYWSFYKSKAELREIATARALYNFLWCIDNVTTTLMSWGWDSSDILILMGRMRSAGFDPWSISDAAGEFLSSLKGHGFNEIERKDGTLYLVYDPKGHGRDYKPKKESDAFIEKYDEPADNLLPEDDGWDDKGARPGEREF